MKKFDEACKSVMATFKLFPESWIKPVGRCKHEWIKLRDESLLTEMNTEVYPMPKELLSRLVDDCYKSGWLLVREYAFVVLAKWMKESENISECQIDWKKMKDYATNDLLLICLPYELSIWKDKLKPYFSEDDISKLFSDFNGQNGARGTYSRGQLIIANSDCINSLKDCEEVLEHELIHMMKEINGEEETCSVRMQQILLSTAETDTWVVNLINALSALYDHKMAMFSDEDDTPEARKRFLDEVFKSAEEAANYAELHQRWQKFEQSGLLKNSLTFLWMLLKWEPDELPSIRGKVYREFLCQ